MFLVKSMPEEKRVGEKWPADYFPRRKHFGVGLIRRRRNADYALMAAGNFWMRSGSHPSQLTVRDVQVSTKWDD